MACVDKPTVRGESLVLATVSNWGTIHVNKLIAAVGATLVLAATPAYAAQQDFNLTNSTGYTINEVYVSATNTKDWEEDIMGADALPDGGSVDISFDAAENACRFDMKVVYDDEEEAIWTNFNLCTISTIELKYNRSTGTTTAVTD
jgi:hypothetical protein